MFLSPDTPIINYKRKQPKEKAKPKPPHRITLEPITRHNWFRFFPLIEGCFLTGQLYCWACGLSPFTCGEISCLYQRDFYWPSGEVTEEYVCSPACARYLRYYDPSETGYELKRKLRLAYFVAKASYYFKRLSGRVFPRHVCELTGLYLVALDERRWFEECEELVF